MTVSPFLLVIIIAIVLIGGASTIIVAFNKENSGWMPFVVGGMGLIAIALLLLPLGLS